MKLKIAEVPGDGIGPEVVAQAKKVVDAVCARFGHEVEYRFAKAGACAIDEYGSAYPEETHRICMESDAVLYGAVGDPKYDNDPTAKVRPEQGLYDRTYRTDEVIDIGCGEVHLGDLAPNGQQLRPHIVFFGEAVPNIEKAIEIVSRADILLIVGTSLQVYPAAGLYRYAGNQVPIYIIDPAEVPVHDPRITHIRAVATKGMEEFKKYLRNQK